MSLVRSYVGGLDIDSKIARIDMYGGSELTPLFYLGDALATTTHLLNNVGDVTDTFVTNAWGEELDHCGVAAEEHRYSFQQREKDIENGTMNFSLIAGGPVRRPVSPRHAPHNPRSDGGLHALRPCGGGPLRPTA